MEETLEMTEKEEEQIKTFLEDLKKDAEIMEDQVAAANRDMRAIDVEGGMWEGYPGEIPKNRVMMEFDRISPAISRAIGTWNQNRVGVVFKPDDSKGSDADAELVNGIYRADFRQNGGKMATDNAVDEVFKCGYGCFKQGTVFEDEEDPGNDLQRTDWRPIHEAYSRTFWSRQSKRIDKDDSPYVTEIEAFTKDAYKKTYPGKSLVSAFDPDRVWMNGNWDNNQNDVINIATRHEKVKKMETFFVYHNLESGETETYSKKDHEKEESRLKKSDFHVFARERKIKTIHIWKYVFNGKEFIEKPRRVVGNSLPLTAVYGNRSFVNGVERYRGITRKQLDGARLFNSLLSKAAENSSTSGQDLPILDSDSVKGLEDHWADKENKSYLPLRPQKDKDGNIVGPGLIGFYKPGQLDGNAAAIFQLLQQFMQETMGGVPQDTLDPNASGKAINALIKREDLNLQPMFDNIATAIERSGRVWDGMRREIYTTSRIVRTIGKDGTEGRRHLSKAVIDEKTGLPTQENTLEGKRFRVYSDIGPQFETQREQNVEDSKGIMELISKVPGGEQFLLPMIITLFDNMPGDGMQLVKDFTRKVSLLQGFVEPDTDEEKQLVANANQPKEDPNKELTDAVANQANAEARQLDASAFDKVASANKKVAETAKIESEIKIGQGSFLMQVRDRAREQAATGFIN